MEDIENPPSSAPKKKLGRPSLMTLPGVRNSLADLCLKLRRGKLKGNVKMASVLVRAYGKLSDILIAEHKLRLGLDDVSDEVLRDEILRRHRHRLGPDARVVGAKHQAQDS